MITATLAVLMLASAPASAPDLQTILDRMFARLDRDAARKVAGAHWTKNSIEDFIDDPLHPERQHEERFRVWGDGTRMRQQKLMRDGRTVRDKPEPLPFFMDAALLRKFEFSLDEPARVLCGERRVCWRLTFVPRHGAISVDHGVREAMLNNSSGTVLVDTEQFVIVRAYARTTVPYKSFWYDVYWSVVTMVQEPVNGVMIPSFIEFQYAYNPILGRSHVGRRIYTYTDITIPDVP